MYYIKEIIYGQITDPCGTPDMICVWLENVFLICTRLRLFK